MTLDPLSAYIEASGTMPGSMSLAEMRAFLTGLAIGALASHIQTLPLNGKGNAASVAAYWSDLEHWRNGAMTSIEMAIEGATLN